MVVVLILLWNTAGVYSTVCQALCTQDNFPQQNAQASPTRSARPILAGSGAENESRPDSQCLGNLQPGRCIAGTPQPQLRPEVSYAHALVTTVTSVALALESGADSHTHSPPGFTSGRSTCQKLTLLRI